MSGRGSVKSKVSLRFHLIDLLEIIYRLVRTAGGKARFCMRYTQLKLPSRYNFNQASCNRLLEY